MLTLNKETNVRKNYLQNETVDTIYFGGGTPSVLQTVEIESILQSFYERFHISDDVEITLEANPDDLTFEYLKSIQRIGINRLSIGVQSFHDNHLKKMNRRHNTMQAINSIKNAAEIGINNLSVDLIYGLPELSEMEWKDSMNQVFKLPVQHLSAYHLTYHEGTPFYTWLKKGTLKEIKEAESVKQFEMLIEFAEKNGFEHYEISNFAKNKMYSKHNTSYWLNKKYLGLGPSAHSYDGVSRRWNLSSVEAYINAVDRNTNYFEEEVLSEKDKYNEYILTRIRTRWGVSLDFISQQFGKKYSEYFIRQLEKFKDTNSFVRENNVIKLTKKGLFISDEIMTDLMII